MKLISRISVLSALVLVFVLSGCGPAWKVIKASNPTTLSAANNVAVAFDYSAMLVEGKPMETWIAGKTAEDAKYPQTWADLMGKFENAVIDGMRGQYPSAHPVSAGPGDVTVTIRPNKFGLGKYIVVSAWPTTMNVVVAARAGEGENTDEIQFVKSYPASAVQPSVFIHITPVGQDVGRSAAKFLSMKKAK